MLWPGLSLILVLRFWKPIPSSPLIPIFRTRPFFSFRARFQVSKDEAVTKLEMKWMEHCWRMAKRGIKKNNWDYLIFHTFVATFSALLCVFGALVQTFFRFFCSSTDHLVRCQSNVFQPCEPLEYWLKKCRFPICTPRRIGAYSLLLDQKSRKWRMVHRKKWAENWVENRKIPEFSGH